MNSESINLKLNLQFSAVVTVFLCIFSVFNYYTAKNNLHKNLESQAKHALYRLELNLPAIIWDYNTDLLISNVNSELSADFVSGILVISGEDRLALQVKEEGELIAGDTLPEDSAFTKSAKLFFDDSGEVKTVGEVTLFIDDTVVRKILSEMLISQIIQLILLIIVISLMMYLLLGRNVWKPLKGITHAVFDIAEGEGDLTQRLDDKKKDEISTLAAGINLFIKKLQGTITEVSHTSEQLFDSATLTSGNCVKSNESIIRQQSEIEQVATAVTEMSAAIDEVANSASNALNSLNNAKEQAEKGKNIVSKAVFTIEDLSKSVEKATDVILYLAEESENIGSVLDVIRAIASQTNLLALNAAIEAARAGEQGRGFAVVADEVRTLAQRTQDSTQEIQKMIEQLQNSTQEAVSVMTSCKTFAHQGVSEVDDSGLVFQEIVTGFGEMTNLNTHIATATKEQSTVAAEINQNVVNLSDVAHEASALSAQMSSDSESSSSLAMQLRKLMNQFKV
ncbi:methyl-accepting chemotaxis protein [Shewanella sp. VB17]|uniref:methyl-accepting chemotaxis protein n=1 Tax=Shewanella sp. VB17 TaxID=2739432 RepID=UPI001565A2C0|nr:methyl-accepting chemotaxis protein [Shewanella sp. VB17]NRD72533.1 methyl-accepting chemotaxis protein [Shewanella sp. VB17]